MPVNPIMLATTDRYVGNDVIDTLNSDLIDQMGRDEFNAAGEYIAVSRSTSFEYYIKPDDLPESLTTIICHPATPFYGPNYERGYWPNLAALIETLRRRIPESRVWYGPDSTELIEEADEEWMHCMWGHWAKHGGRPYRRNLDS